MGSFEVLSHTADVGFRARGGTLEDLFEISAEAMLSLEYDLSEASPSEEVGLQAQGEDLEELLYGWLSELLWIHDAEEFVPAEVVVAEVVRPGPDGSEFIVRGSARGRRLGDWFRQTGPQLKAVTMHGLSVAEADGSYEATVFLDV
ncbi:MAG: archease [Actinomycetota bacterium]